MNAEPILTELRSTMDRMDLLNNELAECSKRKNELQAKLIEFADVHGIDKVAGMGLSVGVDRDAFRVEYEPEQWDDFARWAFDNGRGYLIQRRITDSRVKSLIEEGIELHPALRITNFTKLNIRRVS